MITTYQQGDFLDLCRGPHVADTGEIGPFKLLSVAGAYWRGDEKRPMLQRIYGTAWPTQEELDAHLQRLEEAQRRDHRRLGRELDLFSVNEEIGPGLILWHPKGAMVRYLIEQFEQKEQLARGYDLVYTPHIASEKIYQTSGHLETYRENMYSPMRIEEVDYYLKPMNCPGHIMIYKSRVHSYRDLPIRWPSSARSTATSAPARCTACCACAASRRTTRTSSARRSRSSTRPRGVLDLAMHMADVFGYEFQAYLATRPEKSIGSEDVWERATDALRRALEMRGLPYKLDEGGGAFYGPKIDIKWVDALGREWTGPTIQVDFNLPERFDVNYIGEDGERHRAAMIHRTLLGSMERFVGGLIEHYAGAFPVWLAPVQAAIIPITDDQIAVRARGRAAADDAGLRVEVNDRRDRMQAKIRDAQLQKIPYMLVIGKREVADDAVAVRLRNGRDLGAMPVDQFLALALPRVESRSLYLDDSRRGRGKKRLPRRGRILIVVSAFRSGLRPDGARRGPAPTQAGVVERVDQDDDQDKGEVVDPREDVEAVEIAEPALVEEAIAGEPDHDARGREKNKRVEAPLDRHGVANLRQRARHVGEEDCRGQDTADAERDSLRPFA